MATAIKQPEIKEDREMEALILLAVLPALYWLLRESSWLQADLMGQLPSRDALRLLTAGKPVLMLNAGNPAGYPMTLKTTTKQLKAALDYLAKTNLTLIEEVMEYDYSDQT